MLVSNMHCKVEMHASKVYSWYNSLQAALAYHNDAGSKLFNMP